MRKTLPILLMFILLTVSACFPLASQSPQVDYSPTLTSYAIEVISLQRDVQELEDQIEDLQSQLDDAEVGLNGLGEMVVEYEEILMGEYYDEDGLMVLCADAFDVSFGYVDRLSMRKQLVQYVYDQYTADGYTVNFNTISSEHQQIWTDEQDALVKIHILDYLEPYVVTFENPEYDIYSAVYSVRWQCFVDHPVLEARYLALHGN